ncbi:universal stress protein [Falsiroseomonas sp. HW251]|uniref:universal stress protein n=1 Tax=Falsiroseomonas sp. HW251 TaxID=3390998 RepID=UPI003D3113E0
MALKDILVLIEDNDRSATRLALACALARRHAAHLTGLFVVDVTVSAIAGADGGGAALAQLVETMRDDALSAGARAEVSFNEMLRREGVVGEWRLVEGLAPQQAALHGRYADLVVLGQQAPDDGGSDATLEAVLFTSGRPVLVVPYAGSFATVGDRALIGWNAKREAARAVGDALPLLSGAATVLIVNPLPGSDLDGDAPGADIARHLARHGVNVTVERIVAPEIGADDALLNRAAETGADLIVIGAYGHSRLREFVLGGVTRGLLRHMTVPVLMSH